jgi:hypothetical protein
MARHRGHKVGKKHSKKSKKSHVRLEPTLKHMGKKGGHKKGGRKRSHKK